jgi:UDP-N-acetyl-D-mannosaminuronic acid dehydrogenase
VSGRQVAAGDRAEKLFRNLTDGIVHLEPEEAELAKLFTNTWRYLNFAVSNQFYMLAEGFGLDFYRIYEGMVRDYPRMAGFARPGFAAGPCLFKDTMQLASFSRNNFFMGHAAMLVNEGLPAFLVDRLKRQMSLRDKTVGIVGMAFKADSDDARESLAYKLRKLLSWECREVLCTDVYIKDSEFVSVEDLLRRSDVVVLSAPHREYKNLDLTGKTVVDVWNFWPRDRA